jgi:hypothetical protein
MKCWWWLSAQLFGMTKKQEKAIPYFEITNQITEKPRAQSRFTAYTQLLFVCVFGFLITFL